MKRELKLSLFWRAGEESVCNVYCAKHIRALFLTHPVWELQRYLKTFKCVYSDVASHLRR